MAFPPPALTVVYGFSVLLVCCSLQLLGAATKMPEAPQGGLERLATTALVPSVLATLVLTPLLSLAHLWEVGLGGAARGGGRRLVAGLAKATFLAATVAFLASAVLQFAADGAVVQIGADGHLDRGRGDVARLNIK